VATPFAERQARPPPEIVIGEGRQHSDAGRRAVLSDVGGLAGDEMIVGDVERVRPGQPGAAAAQVPLAGDGAERAGLVEDSAQSVVGEAERLAGLARGGQPAEQVIGVSDVGLGARQVLPYLPAERVVAENGRLVAAVAEGGDEARRAGAAGEAFIGQLLGIGRPPIEYRVPGIRKLSFVSRNSSPRNWRYRNSCLRV
jgi:hypothetical protein